ncbi:MAG: hypothetical protein WC979_01720 [Candidatus Pacearchaeota archaeon]|jgi:hypothetical protein|nr:hypothetical protein [Clostridia bacterium]
MSNSLYDTPGSSNDRKRIPSFDDYKGMADQIAKYGDELRAYFVMAQTHDDLRTAREELNANGGSKYPDKIIDFMYKERSRSLGPEAKSNTEHNEDDSEQNLINKVAQADDDPTKYTRHRPTWN